MCQKRAPLGVVSKELPAALGGPHPGARILEARSRTAAESVD